MNALLWEKHFFGEGYKNFPTPWASLGEMQFRNKIRGWWWGALGISRTITLANQSRCMGIVGWSYSERWCLGKEYPIYLGPTNSCLVHVV
jgi:hypothetical protein